jgi:hypothetical protein
MVLNSALLLLFRSIGAALLMLADTKIFVAYMAGDHLLYLLLKLVRGDFLHWAPVEGVGGLALSLINRVAVKTLTDFTGIIQFRAAGEMGGALWLWTMFLALVAPWVAVPVYFGSLTRDSTRVADEEGEEKSVDFEQYHAWRLLGSLTAGWVRARAPTPTCLPAPCSGRAERVCGRAEHVCGRAEHMCDLASRRGGSGGLPPTAREILSASSAAEQ